MNNSQDPNTIVLCCHTKDCPKLVRQEDGTILVQDDYHGQVTLKNEELSLLVQWAREGHFDAWLNESTIS